MIKKTVLLKVFAVIAMLMCSSYTDMPAKTAAAITTVKVVKVEDTTKVLNTRKPKELKRQQDLLEIATAISIVESSNNEKAVSKSGKYVGWLQISPVMVDECRKLGYTNIHLSHRKTKEGSMVIFTIMMNNYNPSLTIDRAIEIWNPNCGRTYICSVKDAYKKVKKGEYILDDLHSYKEI